MRARGLALLALAVCLEGCKPAVPAASGAGLSEERLGAELRRCRDLGLKAYDDPTCRAAQAERTRRFFAKPSEAGR